MRNDDKWLELTERFLKAINEYNSTKKWVRPWEIVTPQNKFTGHRYSGMNQFTLMFSGYKSTEWGTFNQWSKEGFRIRKGEKSTFIWSPPRTVKKDENGEKVVIFTVPKSIAIFNAEQIEDYTPPEKPPVEVDPATESILLQRGAVVKDVVKNVAGYLVKSDVITMPPREQFVNGDNYLSVLSHELIHWTGHVSRLNRESLYKYGESEHHHGYEELVAEIGASFLCSKFNLTQVNADGQDAYIAGWATLLTNKENALKSAVQDAINAVTYLTSSDSFIDSDIV